MQVRRHPEVLGALRALARLGAAAVLVLLRVQAPAAGAPRPPHRVLVPGLMQVRLLRGMNVVLH